MTLEHLVDGMRETAHALDGGMHEEQVVCNALRSIIARAGRAEAQAPRLETVEALSAHVAEPCITPECGKQRQWKGLCRSCYGQALRLINMNMTTWDDLEAMGMAVLEDKVFTAKFKQERRKREQLATCIG